MNMKLNTWNPAKWIIYTISKSEPEGNGTVYDKRVA